MDDAKFSPSLKRKPVPTPRSTLRKPAAGSNDRKVQTVNGGDSQGHTSGDSQSPDDGENMAKDTGEDILAALEKIPGVGSLRSLNSVGSSQPSLSTPSDNRFRRDESSHSLASGASLSLASDRKRSLGERSRTSPRILMLNGKASGSASNAHPIQRGTEKRRSSKTVKIAEDGSAGEETTAGVQDRPLPDLPPKNDNTVAESGADDIYTALLTPEDHYQELRPPPVIQPAVKADDQSKNVVGNESKAVDNVIADEKAGNYLTMTGTIKRGSRLPEHSVDLQVSLTQDHFSMLEKRVHDKYHDRCFCGLRRGPHVFALSLLSIPFMLLYSLFQAFFLGSMTWYNIFLHFNEDRTCWHTLVSPFILLVYPIWIAPVTVGLGLYGAVRAVSWYWDSWVAEVRDPDSGFMAWACAKLDLPECSPYQVVLLSAEAETRPQPV